MTEVLRLGLVGLDTSHVIAFTRLLNDPEDPHHVPGARVVAGFPGGSADFELSHSRVGKFTDELREKYRVAILDSPELVAEAVDAVLLTSADGRVHRDQFQEIAGSGRPTFIDKPLATTSDDARAIMDMARQYHIPVTSSSSLRYSQPLIDALSDQQKGAITGVDCCGPMPLEPTQPGLFWYGIHAVEMLYAALGPGCQEVRATRTADHELVVGTWSDGRIGTVRGYRNASGSFGAAIHRKQGLQLVDATNPTRPAYALMLERLLEMFNTGLMLIPVEEMLEIVRFMEAANESRETGRAVRVGE